MNSTQALAEQRRRYEAAQLARAMTGPGTEITVSLKQREWQKPLIKAYRDGIKHGIVVAHRRAGKDRAAMFIELELENKYRGIETWHALPEQEQARLTVWDVRLNDGSGTRLIDAAFPPEIRSKTNNTEMKIEFHTGGIWRLVGADRIDALRGGNPRHVTFSEFATTNPQARQLIRPILAENGGTELIITTPRGYNHAFEIFQHAMRSEQWYAAIHPVSETKLISEAELAEERATTHESIYRQEYECDFSAANLGSVLGKWIEIADRDKRLDVANLFDPDEPVYAASDIGFRDSSSWWFWQPVLGGWFMIRNMTESGWDAEDWIAELQKLDYRYAKIYMPHDAKARTFATKRSSMEAFMQAFGAGVVRVLPQMRIEDRINAARAVLGKCKFAPECHDGLNGLRSWQYEYNEDTRAFSKEPRHDWASHPGDGFSYFATIAEEDKPKPKAPGRFRYEQPAHHAFSLDQLWEMREREVGRTKGI